jgi:hypothetical protein
MNPQRPTPNTQLLDVQRLRLARSRAGEPPDRLIECEVLVVGGGMGGVAAALAAARAGRSVLLTEETDWLGGQMTAQGVSALDEHRFIEEFGGTASYTTLRRTIRDLYRADYRFTASPEAALNPGNGWVSRLCFEPSVGARALDALLAPVVEAGRLQLLKRSKAAAAEVSGNRIDAVLIQNLDTGATTRVRAAMVLDATELGDLLPLAGAEYVSGAEGRIEVDPVAGTSEPSARVDGPAPDCVQSFTYPFVVEFRPGEQHAGEAALTPQAAGRGRVLAPPWLPLDGGQGRDAGPGAEPPGYAENRWRQPYTFDHVYYDGRGIVTYRMFEGAAGAGGPFWTYRRLIDAARLADPCCPNDLSMINWPGNDYRGGNLIDQPPEVQLDRLRAAKELSLGFLHWLQTEAPRDDGGAGYPELKPRPDVMDTADGLSKYPYIRESRRIRAVRVILEQEIAARYQPAARAASMLDSVGIGLYAIDIHPAQGETKLPPDAARPFQIPLSALIPIRLENLLPACKNIGTTHITNGAYRLHPVEWNIGESAALLAAFALEEGIAPRQVVDVPRLTRRFQERLVAEGVPLYWLVDVPPGDPGFAAVQLLATWGVWPGAPDDLEFHPETPVDMAALRRELGPAGAMLPAELPPGMSRRDVARLLYERVREGFV